MKSLLSNKKDTCSTTDYYPFGQPLPDRSFSGEEYRFGFNGKEKVDEITGTTGTDYDFGERMYDSRICKFFSTDALMKESSFQAPYIFAGNNPIHYIDKNGNFQFPTDDELKEQGIKPEDVTRFKNIVDNIQNIVKDNPKALDEIAKTTGYSKEKILADLQPGSGPKVNIYSQYNDISGSNGVISWTYNQVEALQNISSDNKDALASQTLGTAMTLLHEYGHTGDQETNCTTDEYGFKTGHNSGQFGNGGWDADNPSVDATAIKDGKQGLIGGYKNSITGHRGTDITVLGFGINTSYNIDSHTFSVTYPSLIPGIPEKLNKRVTATPTENMRGVNILKTLNVK